MRKMLAAATGLAMGGVIAASVMAADMALDMKKMTGKWKWRDYVVEVTEGGEHGISAKVISGPSNVGMEMIMSKLEEKAGRIVGRIRHPGNGKVYNTNMTMPDGNSWKLDGCTDDGACASGVFTRVK